jgi:hypothetical protein
MGESLRYSSGVIPDRWDELDKLCKLGGAKGLVYLRLRFSTTGSNAGDIAAPSDAAFCS